MITVIYRVIAALAVIFTAVEIFSQRGLKLKINAALVLVPLILRAILVA